MFYEYCIEVRITVRKNIRSGLTLTVTGDVIREHAEILYSEIQEVSSYSESLFAARTYAIQKISEIRGFLVEKGLIETSKAVDKSFSFIVKLISYSSLPPEFKCRGFSNREFNTSIFLPFGDFPSIDEEEADDLTKDEKIEISTSLRDDCEDIENEFIYKAVAKEYELIVFKTSQRSRVLRFANEEFKYFAERNCITSEVKFDQLLNYEKGKFTVILPGFFHALQN